jgi:hypothetical protein
MRRLLVYSGLRMHEVAHVGDVHTHLCRGDNQSVSQSTRVFEEEKKY